MQFQEYFAFPFITPDSPEHFFNNLNILLSSLRGLLYSREKYHFYRCYIEILLLELDKIAESPVKHYLVSLFNGFRFLVAARIESKEVGDNREEYDIESQRRNAIEFFTIIFTDKDYFRIRQFVFSQKESVTRDMVHSLSKNLSPSYKRELLSLIMIIVLFGEEEFFQMWFEMLP